MLRGTSVEQAACIDLLAHIIGLARGDTEHIIDRLAALYAAGETSVSIMRRLNPPANASAEQAVARWEHAPLRAALVAARDIGKPPPFIRPDTGICIEEHCGVEFEMNKFGRVARRCADCRRARRQTREGRRKSREGKP